MHWAVWEASWQDQAARFSFALCALLWWASAFAIGCRLVPGLGHGFRGDVVGYRDLPPYRVRGWVCIRWGQSKRFRSLDEGGRELRRLKMTVLELFAYLKGVAGNDPAQPGRKQTIVRKDVCDDLV